MNLHKAKLFSQLLRFRYHHNFLAVVVGAFVAAPDRVGEVWPSFFAHYVTFAVGLYGGIYTINGLIDASHDREHATKRLRPLASGAVSRVEAIALVVVCWILGFGGSFWWSESLRFWPLYTAFIVVNLVYSLVLRHTQGRFLVGITTPMRMQLGAVIVGAPLPWPVLALAFLFMCGVQALKFRLEATGSGAPHPSAKGAPLEALVGLSVVLVGWQVVWGDPANQAFVGIVVASNLVFIGVPWAVPSTSPRLVGLDLPVGVEPSRAERWVRALVAVRDGKGLVLFTLLYSVCLLNRAVMWLEDRLVPSLRDVPLDRLVFILGHQRAGTTHLHRALANHPSAHSSTMLSLWFPALFLRPLERVSMRILRRATAAYATANHRIDLEEPLEEHVWCLHHLRGNALFMLFPSVWDHPDVASLYAEALAFDTNDVMFVRSCLRRVLRGRPPGSVYVGRPLGMTRQHALLREAFPHARFLVCARDAQESMTSWVDLFASTAGVPVTEPSFQALMQRVYEDYSRPTFEAVMRLTDDSGVFVVRFHDWKASPGAVVSEVVPWAFGTSIEVEQAEALVPARGEHHRNAPGSASVVVIGETLGTPRDRSNR